MCVCEREKGREREGGEAKRASGAAPVRIGGDADGCKDRAARSLRRPLTIRVSFPPRSVTVPFTLDTSTQQQWRPSCSSGHVRFSFWGDGEERGVSPFSFALLPRAWVGRRTTCVRAIALAPCSEEVSTVGAPALVLAHSRPRGNQAGRRRRDGEGRPQPTTPSVWWSSSIDRPDRSRTLWHAPHCRRMGTAVPLESSKSTASPQRARARQRERERESEPRPLPPPPPPRSPPPPKNSPPPLTTTKKHSLRPARRRPGRPHHRARPPRPLRRRPRVQQGVHAVHPGGRGERRA